MVFADNSILYPIQCTTVQDCHNYSLRLNMCNKKCNPQNSSVLYKWLCYRARKKN